LFFVDACDPRLAEFGLTRCPDERRRAYFWRNHVALAEKKEDNPKAGLFSLTVDVVAVDPTYSIFAEDATVLRNRRSHGMKYGYARVSTRAGVKDAKARGVKFARKRKTHRPADYPRPEADRRGRVPT
jgi:hypothetical protein